MTNIEPFIDLYSIWGVMCMGNGFLIAIYFLTRWKKNSLAMNLMALLLFMITFHLSHDLLIYTRYIIQFPHFNGLGAFFILALGPLIYLMGLTLKRSENKIGYVHLLHFIPFVLFHLSQLPYYLDSASNKILAMEYYYQYQTMVSVKNISFLAIMYFLHLLSYLIATSTMFWEKEASIPGEFFRYTSHYS